MKKLFIVGNWKSEKTTVEANNWIKEIAHYLHFSETRINALANKQIIICPSYVLLPDLKFAIKNNHLPFLLGSQNVSQFPPGAYTGEVNAEQISEFASYTLIGHSERRSYLHEEDNILEKKVAISRQHQIIPIYCVPSSLSDIPKSVKICAYEPVAAIGTGNPDDPKNIESVAKTIKMNREAETVLYGGSVTPDNVHQFTSLPSIDGVLVGKASLDPISFAQIILSA